MSLAIHSLTPASVSLASALQNLPQATTDASASGPASPLTVSTSPPTDNPKLKESLKALGLQAKLADDLQDVATALTPAMQKIIEERPDLATASFDFRADHGSIAVVSSSLSERDRAWLSQTLNGSPALVQAVQVFHDDASASYQLWSEGNSDLSAKAKDAATVSDLADRHFSFMSLFRQASQAMSQAMDPNAHYSTSNGAPIDFSKTVDSPLSFLVFQKSNQAVLTGSNSDTTRSGRTDYGAVRGNFFSSVASIRDFLPSSSRSAGLDVSA